MIQRRLRRPFSAAVEEERGELAADVSALRGTGIVEIQDLTVLPEFERQGIASGLLDEVEALAGERSPVVGIGVGLYPGAVQRLYGKRGYIPDGRGITYRDRFPEERAHILLDDELVLHLPSSRPRSFASYSWRKAMIASTRVVRRGEKVKGFTETACSG